MEQRSHIYNVLVLLIVGSIVQSPSLDISSYQVLWRVSPLALFHGPALQPSIFNLLLAKIALFFLLWGFLKVFGQLGRPLAGFIGGLALAVYPAVSLNSGYLAWFLIAMALFWWAIVLANGYERPRRYSAALLISLPAAFVVSPWMLLLAGLPAAFHGNGRSDERRAQRTALVLLALLGLVCLMILLVPFAQPFENAVLLNDNLLWPRRFLTMAMTFNQNYSWGASILVFVGIAYAIRTCPRLVIFLIVSFAVLLLFVSFDLGGILICWVFFSTLIGLAFEKIYHVLKYRRKMWLANLLLIGFVVCLFSVGAQGQLSKVMQAKQYYKKRFYHKCGKVVAHPSSATGRVVMGTPGAGGDDGCLLAWGNYHHALPGRYRATYYLCGQDAGKSYVDVTQGYGAVQLVRKDLVKTGRSADCTQSLFPLSVDYTVKDNLSSPVEHRLFYAGEGVVYFDRVEVEILHESLWSTITR